MPWYKFSRTDCATVTHLHKLRPNTAQRHAIRTVRNIVKEHSLGASASHREKYAPAARHYGATMPARYNTKNTENTILNKLLR